jgi:hypothetical protein
MISWSRNGRRAKAAGKPRARSFTIDGEAAVCGPAFIQKVPSLLRLARGASLLFWFAEGFWNLFKYSWLRSWHADRRRRQFPIMRWLTCLHPPHCRCILPPAMWLITQVRSCLSDLHVQIYVLPSRCEWSRAFSAASRSRRGAAFHLKCPALRDRCERSSGLARAAVPHLPAGAIRCPGAAGGPADRGRGGAGRRRPAMTGSTPCRILL